MTRKNKNCVYCGKPTVEFNDYCEDCMAVRKELLTSNPTLISYLSVQKDRYKKREISFCFIVLYFLGQSLTEIFNGPLWLEAFFIIGAIVALISYPVNLIKEHKAMVRTGKLLDRLMREQLAKGVK